MSAASGLARLKRVSRRLVGDPGKRHRERAIKVLEQSSLFDRDWYREKYPDVAASGIDPALHYFESGWREGRDPGPGFSTSAYLKANADVAASGINPLLHYVEHGHSEGRGAPEHASPKSNASRPPQDFGPPAQCVAFPLPQEPPLRWARTGKIDIGMSDVLQVGDQIIGFFRDTETKAGVEAAIAALGQLARHSPYAPSEGEGHSEVRPTMLDAWYVNHRVLRTRWNTDGRPLVVRVLQQPGDEPILIAEALTSGPLDAIDASLVNPFFPLLFLFADCDGALIGWQFLAFPSLCRGGLHYLELVALGQGGDETNSDSVHPCRLSEQLAKRLQRLLAQRRPLISTIYVDLADSDGTGPLFQSDFQLWLKQVIGVSLKPLEAPARHEQEHYLADSVDIVSKGRLLCGAAGSLTLRWDMVPSISSLVGISGSLGGNPRPVMGLIAAGAEHSQPATLFHLPAGERTSVEAGLPRIFPSLEPAGSADDVSIAALRTAPARPLHESELLMPFMAPTSIVPPSTAPITWLFWPDGWAEKDILHSLESIAAQLNAGRCSIAFVGAGTPRMKALAEQLFEGRFRSFLNLDEAVSAIDTPLTAYVGPSVILHDRRTAGLLSAVLADPGNVSASAVILNVGKQGKRWTVGIADAGTIPTLPHSERTSALEPRDAMLIWRATWAVVRPPRDLWMTRTANIAAWRSSDGATLPGGRHICSSAITASYCSVRQDGPAPLSPPANPHCALRTEVLIG